MATQSERITVLETRLDGIDTRLADMSERMNSLEGRLNVQIQITVAMWATTMLAILATLAAVLLTN